eukprot:106167_1
MYVYIINAILILNCYASPMIWKLSNQTLSELQSTEKAFIAYHNNTVYVLGGYGSQTDKITFPLDVEWIHHETTIDFVYQKAQSSIQINNNLWMLPFASQTINIFDLQRNVIAETVSFPGVAIEARCVTKYDQFLLVLGGADAGLNYFTEFNIYNMLTKTWSSGTNLSLKRGFHSCNVVGDTIYVIGGYYDTTYVD